LEGINVLKRERVNKLPETSEYYRALFENAPVGIGLSNLDGRVLACNTTMLKITGYGPGDVANLALSDIYFDTNDRNRILTIFREKGIVNDFETRLRRKDGTVLHVSLTVSPFQQSDPEIMVTVLLDISEQKKAEQALRESEEKYRSLAENTSDIVYSLNLKGELVFISPRVRHYDYEPDELIGTNFLELVSPEDREMVSADFEKSISDRKISPPIEFRILNREGKTFWLEERSQFNYDEQGEIIGLTGVARDITERKIAEEALRKSEINFRRLFDRMPDAVTLIVEEKLVYANGSFLQMFEFEEKDIPNLNFNTFRRIFENPDRLFKRIEEILSGGPEYPSEYTALDRHGTRIPIEIFSRKITYQGKPALLSVVRNLTERKKLELQIHRQNERLKKLVDERSRQALRNERLAAAGRLLAGYVHQIGNPVQSIFSCLDRLENLTGGNVELSREVLGVRSHINLIADLGRQLKNIYQPHEPEFTLINVNDIVLEVTELYSTRLAETGIKLKLELDKSSAKAFMEETSLYTTLGNLILNAIDAMPEGGELTISTVHDKNRLRLEVTDNGRGIDSSNLPKVFKPFFTTKPPDKATGLGLTLVKEAVEAAGGSITVSSKVDWGTKIIVTLLRKAPENFSRRVGTSTLGFLKPQF
jgi:PAS domain S-box-containing protein